MFEGTMGCWMSRSHRDCVALCRTVALSLEERPFKVTDDSRVSDAKMEEDVTKLPEGLRDLDG